MSSCYHLPYLPKRYPELQIHRRSFPIGRPWETTASCSGLFYRGTILDTLTIDVGLDSVALAQMSWRALSMSTSPAAAMLDFVPVCMGWYPSNCAKLYETIMKGRCRPTLRAGPDPPGLVPGHRERSGPDQPDLRHLVLHPWCDENNKFRNMGQPGEVFSVVQHPDPSLEPGAHRHRMIKRQVRTKRALSKEHLQSGSVTGQEETLPRAQFALVGMVSRFDRGEYICSVGSSCLVL